MMQPQCGVSNSRLNWYIEVVVAHGARNTVARQEGTPCDSMRHAYGCLRRCTVLSPNGAASPSSKCIWPGGGINGEEWKEWNR